MRACSWGFMLAAALLAGCEETDYGPLDPKTGAPFLPLPDGEPPELAPGASVAAQSVGADLKQVGSCDELVELFRANAIADMVQRVQAAFASAWTSHSHCNDYPGYPGYPGGYADAAAMASADAGAGSVSPSPSDPEHSETNNQVAGVDEADLVKTDGNYIYLLSGGTLRILQSWPAADTREIARVAVEGEAKKIFVHQNRALVYSSLGTSYGSSGYGGYQGSGECTYGYDCVPTGDGHPTKITILDITDRRAPKLVRELKLSSSLLSARRIGTAIHTVLTSPRGALPELRTYVTLDVCNVSKGEIYRAYKKLLAENIAILRGAALASSLFPTATDTVHENGQTTTNPTPLGDCRNYLQSRLTDGQQFTSVLSLNLTQETPAAAVTILSQPGVVYASDQSLYLAVPRSRSDGSWYSDLPEAKEVTNLHKFHLAPEGARPTYLASGLVEGRLLNQFALDEYQGFLRLASTSGHVGYGSSATNTITVLEEQGSRLAQVGLLQGLGPSEDIRSVRFDGDRGYVVTFKKTDPLFVLDLARPTQPRVLGELKIPGFSTYMQRMDANHLLTIGYDADEQGSFAWFAGVMLQVFDVTVPTAPKLMWKQVIGTRGSSSEALTNHLAFTYYAPKNILALPMTICEGGDGGSYGQQMTFSGLMVYDVTLEKGFSLRGKVTHPDPNNGACSNWWTDASSSVKRSLIIDDFVYSMSDELLKVNALGNLGTDLVSLPLLP